MHGARSGDAAAEALIGLGRTVEESREISYGCVFEHYLRLWRGGI